MWWGREGEHEAGLRGREMPWVGWMIRGGGLLDWAAWGFSSFIFAGTFFLFFFGRGSLCRLLKNTLLSAYIYIAGLITALIHLC